MQHPRLQAGAIREVIAEDELVSSRNVDAVKLEEYARMAVGEFVPRLATAPMVRNHADEG